MKVDHIGIAVKNLQEALSLYVKILENTKIDVEEVPTEKVRVAMIAVGETRIELLEHTSEESAVAKFINEKGVDNIAVDDIKARLGERPVPSDLLRQSMSPKMPEKIDL